MLNNNNCADSAIATTPSQESLLPDKDSIKMFVGQIPKAIEEAELRKVFEQFGPVYELNILRNSKTDESKGCCFVRFFKREDALTAQTSLNNKCMLNSANPVQMKPADLNRKNRKIFIGMISHYLDETGLCQIFNKFGPIDDCKILRDLNGRSKCCAFITYTNKCSASNAIKFMHRNFTMKNCSNPINVKYADSSEPKLFESKETILTNEIGTASNLDGLLSFQQLISNINSENNCKHSVKSTYNYNEELSFEYANDSNNCKFLFGLGFSLEPYFLNESDQLNYSKCVKNSI